MRTPLTSVKEDHDGRGLDHDFDVAALRCVAGT